MKSQEAKDSVADKNHKVKALLSERVDIINHISVSVFNIIKEGGSDSSIEPFHDITIAFSGANISVKGKDEKFQKIDSEIKQLMDSASQKISEAQDFHANSSTEKGKDTGNTEHLKEEISQVQKEMANKKSEIGELRAKKDHIAGQKESNQIEYEGIKAAKEELLKGLTPKQFNEVTLNDPSGHNDSTQLMGDDSSS